MSQTKRNYKATFILDNRGKEDSVDQIIEGVKKEIVAVHGEVTGVENIGRRQRLDHGEAEVVAGGGVLAPGVAQSSDQRDGHDSKNGVQNGPPADGRTGN